MKEDLIKYAVIAAAGYFAYQYLKIERTLGSVVRWSRAGRSGSGSSRHHGSPGHHDHAAGIEHCTTGNSTVSAAEQSANAAASNAYQVQQTVDQQYLQRAAANSTWATDSHVAGVRLTWDQWNYYLGKFAEANSTQPQPVYGPEDVGITDRYTLLTAVDYHNMKAAKGLSGLGAALGILPYRTWGARVN